MGMHNNATIFREMNYNIKKIAQELSQSLDAPIKSASFYQNEDRTLGEVTLIELPQTLCILLNGKIFKEGEASPHETATYILEDVVAILNKYPHLLLQVTGHSDKTTESDNIDLSDNRALAIAEILYGLDSHNDIYAKGCGDKKPLFTSFIHGERVSNARVEIYLYADKEQMVDHCK